VAHILLEQRPRLKLVVLPTFQRSERLERVLVCLVSRELVLLRVEDSDGVVGYGEAAPRHDRAGGETGRARKFGRRGNMVRYRVLQRVGEVGAVRREKFDAVGFNRMVRCGDHDAGGCFDVLMDNGLDPSIRPNQIFAIALDFPVLDEARWKRVVDVVRDELLTLVLAGFETTENSLA